MQRLILNWRGPIDLQTFEKTQASSVSLDDPPNNRPVVYLWCIRIVRRGEDGLAVNYVGSTRQFQTRMRRHCQYWVNGKYSLFDPQDAIRGEINIRYIPRYDQWDSCFEQVARADLSLIKVFWAEVEDKPKEVESALKLKLTRKQETRGYLYSQEQMTSKLHHDFIENRFPDRCRIIGF